MQKYENNYLTFAISFLRISLNKLVVNCLKMICLRIIRPEMYSLGLFLQSITGNIFKLP